MSSELVPLIDQQPQQQVSFHFWSCQLTEANPKYHWEPEKSASGALKSPEVNAANGKDGNKEMIDNGEDAKGAGATSEHTNVQDAKSARAKSEVADSKDANGDDMADADYMQHVLKVSACILGPKSAGVHLVAVRTRCYRQADPVSCPIVCIDPASQRTVALGYEFVLDSQNEVVTFELVEGAGPVWLTGLHQVRLHDADDEDDDVDEELGSDDDSDELCVIDDTSRFRLAGVKVESEEQEDEAMNDGEDQEEDDADGEEKGESAKNRKAKPKAVGKRSPITTAQLRRRKRRRLANGDGDDDSEGESTCV